MSIADFSKTFKDRIRKNKKLFKVKVDSKTGKEYLTGGFLGGSEQEIKNLRERFKAGKRNNIILTKQGLLNILSLDQNIKNASFETFANFILEKAGKSPNFSEQGGNINLGVNVASYKNANTQDPWLVINEIPYDNLAKWTKEYLVTIGNSINQVDALFKNIETGHTVGLFSYRTMITFGSTIGTNGRIKLRDISSDLELLDRISQLLLDLDIATTNSAKYDMGVYGYTVKDAKKGIMNVELQLKEENQKSADAIKSLSRSLADITRAVKKNTDGKATKELERLGLVLQNANLVDFAQKKFTELAFNAASQNLEELLNMKGSPSFKELIEQQILSSLSNTFKAPSIYKTEQVFIDKLSAELISGNVLDSLKSFSKDMQEAVNREKKVLKALKLKTQAKIKNKQGQFTSLTSLQNLINSKLAEQIKTNMGSGFSKSVLNNRTGRFASSAQVERLTISKQGMITAFYSYMKSPYQTFEPGFAQGSPRTRDPKLLIGKSIREIAANSMANRLRAVSI